MLRSSEELKRVWKDLNDKNVVFNDSFPPPKGFEETAWERYICVSSLLLPEFCQPFLWFRHFFLLVEKNVLFSEVENGPCTSL